MGTDHPSRANVVDASDEPLAPRPRLVVPRHPGSLLRLDAIATADELDQLIDEVFGPTTDERPGVFDAVLLVGGIALGAWGWLTNATGWVVVGVALMVLGIALPARALVRARRGRRREERERALAEEGLLLDAEDPATRALADAYDALEDAASMPGVPLSPESIAAAHAALLEAASLLGGRPPASDAERAYVARRTRAILSVTTALVAATATFEDSGDPVAGGPDVEARTAIVQARELLETASGVGAVDELERLNDRLRATAGNDGT